MLKKFTYLDLCLAVFAGKKMDFMYMHYVPKFMIWLKRRLILMKHMSDHMDYIDSPTILKGSKLMKKFNIHFILLYKLLKCYKIEIIKLF